MKVIYFCTFHTFLQRWCNRSLGILLNICCFKEGYLLVPVYKRINRNVNIENDINMIENCSSCRILTQMHNLDPSLTQHFSRSDPRSSSSKGAESWG